MAILGSIGLAIIYGFKVNVSIAIVAMVNHTAIKLAENHTAINVTEATLNVTSKVQEVNIDIDIYIFIRISININFLFSFCYSLHLQVGQNNMYHKRFFLNAEINMRKLILLRIRAR